MDMYIYNNQAVYWRQDNCDQHPFNKIRGQNAEAYVSLLPQCIYTNVFVLTLSLWITCLSILRVHKEIKDYQCIQLYPGRQFHTAIPGVDYSLHHNTTMLSQVWCI